MGDVRIQAHSRASREVLPQNLTPSRRYKPGHSQADAGVHPEAFLDAGRHVGEFDGVGIAHGQGDLSIVQGVAEFDEEFGRGAGVCHEAVEGRGYGDSSGVTTSKPVKERKY